MRDRVHFKRRSFYSAFGFAAAGIALPAGAANLLVNPGFEAPQPAAVDQNCTGWTFDNNCQRAQFYNNTPGGNTSIWAKTFQPAGGGIEQVVNVIAGSTYNFQSYVLFESAYNTTTATIQLGLTFLDA
ncbi:MAG TPA: hypothetical protein VLI90_14625, partial [Tepidisphaeraceae bacterium]|nr:hypothetical protein [Tepidisphaeraceae bacterium]